MKASFLLLASFASLPLVSTAQSTAVSPRFYVGLGASAVTDRGFRSVAYNGDPAKIGPALTVGAWLSPRLAVQVSGAAAWTRDTYSYVFYDYSTPTPTPTLLSTIESRQTLYTLPVLLRYTLTPRAARFHLDALGGITILHNVIHGTVTTIDSQTGLPSGYPYDGPYDRSQNWTGVTLGPALRYALTPNLQVTADPLVSVRLGQYYPSTIRDRLFWNFQVGVHYSFGQI